MTSRCSASMLVLVFNVERYLRQCLESLISQTFTTFRSFASMTDPPIPLRRFWKSIGKLTNA